MAEARKKLMAIDISYIKQVNRGNANVVVELTCSLQSLQHRGLVSCLSLFYRYYFSRCSNRPSGIVPLMKTFARNSRLASVGNSYLDSLGRCRTSRNASYFIHFTATICKKLPLSVFLLSLDTLLIAALLPIIDLASATDISKKMSLLEISAIVLIIICSLIR